MAGIYTTFLLASIISFAFVIGIIIGWRILRDPDPITKADLRIAVGALVALAWAASIAAEILIPAYTVSVLIHGIMGAVVGYLFSEDGLTFNIGGE